MKLCFASNNAHKLDEVRHAVGHGFEILSLKDINCLEELPETSNTLEGNSFQKAEFVYTHYGVACFADDTGLEVDALANQPGVDSAHYAGPQRSAADNMALLLKNLDGHTNRQARFRTVITLIGLTPEPLFFEGVVPGTILQQPRGTAGFGYDPIFLPDGYTTSFAEMTLGQKNGLSHRAIAVAKLKTFLQNRFRTP